jgi:hypothetical protein
MTKITPIMPSKSEDTLKASLKKLLEAAAATGVALDPDGFARSWLSDNTRVVVAYDGDTPTGFGIMAFGRRYYDGNMTASVLTAAGKDRPAVLEFLLDMCKVLGAEALFYEAEEGDTLGGNPTNMRMVEVT